MNTYFSKKNKNHHKAFGFTLVEIIVAVGIFSLVMVTTTSSLLTVIHANSKSQTLKSVIDNLNVAVENISRSVRIGTEYECTNAGTSCAGGDTSFSFVTQDNLPTTYYFGDQQNSRGETVGALFRVQEGLTVALTAPEVDIADDSRFYLVGNGEDVQPRLMIVVKGQAGSTNSNDTQSLFNVQTTVSKRAYGVDAPL